MLHLVGRGYHLVRVSTSGTPQCTQAQHSIFRRDGHCRQGLWNVLQGTMWSKMGTRLACLNLLPRCNTSFNWWAARKMGWSVMESHFYAFMPLIVSAVQKGPLWGIVMSSPPVRHHERTVACPTGHHASINAVLCCLFLSFQSRERRLLPKVQILSMLREFKNAVSSPGMASVTVKSPCISTLSSASLCRDASRDMEWPSIKNPLEKRVHQNTLLRR